MNDRINALRKSLKLTQTEFAERLGITQNYVALIEMGKRTPSLQLIMSICRTFGINREWLDTGQGEMQAAAPTAAQLVDRVMRGENAYAKSVMSAFAALDDHEWQQLRGIVDILKKAGL